MSTRSIANLQRALNTAARVVCLVSKFDHIKPALMNLHCRLPVRYRVIFKILLLVYKALHGLASKYICDMLSYKQRNGYSLRSDERSLFHVPTWTGSLELDLRSVFTLLNSFKINLKTFLHKDGYMNEIPTMTKAVLLLISCFICL